MSEPMLEVRDLRVAVQGTEAVRGASFDVAAGETVALVGASGAGKSLTAKAILGMLPIRSETAGSIRIAGTEVLDSGRKARAGTHGRVIGYVPQDALAVLSPVHRVGDQIAAAIASVQGLDRAAAKREAVKALAAVGIPDAERRAADFPHQYSGGMRQRAVIAMATVNAPKLIVADEPTTALDVRTQRQILDLLAERCADTGTALLLITHDRKVVEARADRVLTMAAGSMAESGSPVAEAVKPRSPVPDADSLLTVRDLVVEYRGARRRLRRGAPLRAVDGVSFDLAAGETLALIGHSGSGKSSIASAVLRLLKPASGSIVFEGKELTGLSDRELRPLRRTMQPVLQDPYGSLSPRLTAAEAIAEPLRVQRRWDPVAGPARVAELLALTGLDPELAQRYPHELSGGQCQRVNIARALASEPRLLVLDEPTSALDAELRSGILDLLVELQERLGLGYLFICHDLDLVGGFAHRTAVIEDGRIVEHGPAAEIAADANR